MSNSAHMRFVHSRCHLELFFSGYALDRRCDFRSLVELGECGLPWTISSPMLLCIPHQFIEAFSCVVPGTLVVHIATRPLNGVGPWTVGQQPKHRKTGGTRQPLVDGFRFMNAAIIHDHIRFHRDKLNRYSVTLAALPRRLPSSRCHRLWLPSPPDATCAYVSTAASKLNSILARPRVCPNGAWVVFQK